MRKKSIRLQKHEILIWVFMSMTTGFLAYITTSGIQNSIESFQKTEGTIIAAKALKKSNKAYFRGLPIKVSNTHFRIGLDSSPIDFSIFRTDRDYSDYESSIVRGSYVKIYFERHSDDSLLDVIQIESEGILLYSKEEWNQQQRINFFMFIFSSILFLSVGIYRHRRFLRRRSS